MEERTVYEKIFYGLPTSNYKPFEYREEKKACGCVSHTPETQIIDRERFIAAWQEMQKEVHKIARSKGWWDTERSDGEIIALIHSELSEALEACRKEYPNDEHLPNRGSLEVELADAVIRIMDWADEMRIDLAGALVDKIEFNRSRPFKHNKAF